ncbi:unnamed protein product [Nezara viridula]|uniref:Uncharacterized protein n=1 Tax=Nezara viridula TaxID=85310 RepID=A0A9P0EB46_NEZVI|nr:unnamed protein product [Nezara viridula]
MSLQQISWKGTENSAVIMPFVLAVMTSIRWKGCSVACGSRAMRMWERFYLAAGGGSPGLRAGQIVIPVNLLRFASVARGSGRPIIGRENSPPLSPCQVILA